MSVSWVRATPHFEVQGGPDATSKLARVAEDFHAMDVLYETLDWVETRVVVPRPCTVYPQMLNFTPATPCEPQSSDGLDMMLPGKGVPSRGYHEPERSGKAR